MSKSIPKNRRAAFNNQGGLCYYCGFPMWLSEPDRFAVAFKIGKGDSSRFQCTAEHLVAKQNGGGNSAVNVVAACRFCNSRRHRRSSPPSPSAHKKRVQKRLSAGRWHPSHLRRLTSTGCRPT